MMLCKLFSQSCSTTLTLSIVFLALVSALTAGDNSESSYTESTIRKVHIVFMNHLDVGYYDGRDADVGFVYQVLNLYLSEYFERGISLSERLIQEGYVERFVYTTQPWLVSLYLDCPNITLLNVPLKCPSKTQQDNFRMAVQKGYIAWHAGPMNLQTDNIGARLFGYGLDLSKSLDKMFGINRTHATYSQRDVPGLTKAVIPILMSRGVKAVSVGVNPGTAPPAVPSPFVWKFSESDDEGVMGFWDKGGYPLNPGPDPAHPRGLARDKCVMVDGLNETLCFAFRTDNTGPPVSVEEVLQYYEILRAEFPKAELVASTFDNFVKVLETVKSSLPVRSFEIGDTWIQGIASDPKKTAQYRAVANLWDSCHESGQCSYTDERIQNMLRFLIKSPEHTWGAHDFLDHKAWTNQELAAARKTHPYMYAEDAWREQRQFLDYAVAALEDHPLRRMIAKEFQLMTARTPNLTDYVEVEAGKAFSCPDGVVLAFAADGSLSRLFDPYSKVEWASEDFLLGQLTYDTYIEKDFIHMAELYNYEAGVGYDKPNLTKYAHPEKRRWKIRASHIYRRKNDPSCDFWVHAATTDNQTRSKYGASQSFYMRYNYISSSRAPGFDVTFLMLGKVTTRLPESISIMFTPQTTGRTWMLSKLGSDVDPCNVVLNGSQYVHGVGKGVSLTNQSGYGLQILSADVPVVLIGTKDHVTSPFPVPLQPLKCTGITSVAFNVFNNIWNTNYIYYYPYNQEDADFKGRFSIRFQIPTLHKRSKHGKTDF